jgi:glucose-1-phosphate thymidylyltransferase
MEKAVILAAGRGTRMQRPSDAASLTPDQSAVANSGIKSLMPVGRPFIDYVLGSLKSAGYRRICLVVRPDNEALREHCRQYARDGFEIEFAIQEAPLGTANALASAREFAGDDPFLAINADNYYPVSALAKLRALDGAAVAAFTPDGLCRGNITPDRLRNFAYIVLDSAGRLSRVVEKPDDRFSLSAHQPVLINMNCWRFTPVIFEACEAIPLSARNEYELTDAVSHAIDVLNEPFSVIEVDEPVLDLSTRADIGEVMRRLASVEVRL